MKYHFQEGDEIVAEVTLKRHKGEWKVIQFHPDCGWDIHFNGKPYTIEFGNNGKPYIKIENSSHINVILRNGLTAETFPGLEPKTKSFRLYCKNGASIEEYQKTQDRSKLVPPWIIANDLPDGEEQYCRLTRLHLEKLLEALDEEDCSV